MLYFSRWKTILIWVTVVAGLLISLPNLLSRSHLDALPDWLPKRSMTLGLDLQGGSYILLQVDRPSLEKARLQSLLSDARNALRGARVGFSNLSESGNGVDITLLDPGQTDAARTALRPLSEAISSGLLSGGSVSEVSIDEPQAGRFRLGLTEAGLNLRTSNAVSQSIEVVRRRVDELGTTEPVIQRQGNDRIMVQVPGLQDPQRLKTLLDKTAQLTFRLVDTTASADEVARGGRPPAGTQLLMTGDTPPRPVLVQNQVMVSGANLSNAQAGFSQQTNESVVDITFDSRGAQQFGAVTQQNVGRPFAIVLDNVVLSAPTIREAIIGGRAQISGSFTTQSANDLAVLLRAGALPATLNIIEERTVGPGLGADSIKAGQMAAIVGGVFVIGFMLLCYGFLGLLANIALTINIVLLVALLTLLGATLTLPGIAGIVLTMGMAVDSNVLIYERIYEERRNGRSVVQSLDAGFSKAIGTIMDANVTSLIAAAILFYLGSGPVRGFAVTLALGIVTTVFTATTLTRWLVAIWFKTRRPREVPRGWWTPIPHGTRIGFMKVRNFAFTATATVSIIALVGFFSGFVNYGIDFTGGTVIEARAKSGQDDVAKIREDLSSIIEGEIQVQEFGSEGDVLIRYGVQTADAGRPQASVEAARTALSAEYDVQRVEVVGPTVSGELAYAAFAGLIAAMIGIAIYVWFRFEWQFAIGALVATAHDAIMTLGLFVVTGLEFNLSSIAAVLTVIGYSLNDTVVVFDRMRENLRKYKKMPVAEVIDLSLNETLSRTILTASTALLALAALYFFGGEVIRGFVAPMIVGVVVGIYSSIYIAAPLLIFFKLRGDQTAEDADTKKAAASGNSPTVGKA
ncbi:protein translocase subunit SecD [Aureimonas psammosilenae]|uniref:protein translocase subunit SecD n=1 Tax=Aureimonas psammosilenae TaxID=2495496 RepID=UPI001260586E|nr:protein translocase subunit SecD [Aureimonas psammosilenae]